MVDGATVQHSVPLSRERFSYFWRRCFYEGISKALLRRLTDERALDTERRYASRTLRAAIGRDLRATFALRHPKTSLLRICVGGSGPCCSDNGIRGRQSLLRDPSARTGGSQPPPTL